MRRGLLPALLLASAAALGDGDPEGTASLRLETGQTTKVPAISGSNILCDDLTVVSPEFSQDGNDWVLRALRPGSTLCGVWFAGEKPGGLYRVVVNAGPGGSADGGAPTHLAPDSGGGDAGAGFADASVSDSASSSEGGDGG